MGGANEGYDWQFWHLSQTFEGGCRIDGRIDAEGGAILRTALDAVMGPRQEGDNRMGSERCADAAVEMARRQLDSGQLPEAGGQKPHVAVTVDLATLSNEPGSMAAELEWSLPIPAETARRLACDAAITPIIDGEPITPAVLCRSDAPRAGRPRQDLPVPWLRLSTGMD